MERSFRRRSVIGAAALICAVPLVWKYQFSDEAAVRRFLQTCADAAERRDADAVLDCVSLDAEGLRNMKTYSSLATLLERGYAQIDGFEVDLGIEDIEMREQGATVRTTTMIVAEAGEARYLVLGQPLHPERLLVQISRDPTWKIVRVSPLPSTTVLKFSWRIPQYWHPVSI